MIVSHLTVKLNETTKTKIQTTIFFLLTSHALDNKLYLKCVLISLLTAFLSSPRTQPRWLQSQGEGQPAKATKVKQMWENVLKTQHQGMGDPWKAPSPLLGSGRDKRVEAPLALELLFWMWWGRWFWECWCYENDAQPQENKTALVFFKRGL